MSLTAVSCSPRLSRGSVISSQPEGSDSCFSGSAEYSNLVTEIRKYRHSCRCVLVILISSGPLCCNCWLTLLLAILNTFFLYILKTSKCDFVLPFVFFSLPRINLRWFWKKLSHFVNHIIKTLGYWPGMSGVFLCPLSQFFVTDTNRQKALRSGSSDSELVHGCVCVGSSSLMWPRHSSRLCALINK